MGMCEKNLYLRHLLRSKAGFFSYADMIATSKKIEMNLYLIETENTFHSLHVSDRYKWLSDQRP